MQCRDVDHIIAFCEENILSFNCVNVSTALNRLAKLKDDNLPYSSLGYKLSTIIEMMKLKALHLYMDFKPRELANVLWALAALGADPGADLVKKVSFRSVALANGFKPQEIANLFWSLAKLGLEMRPELICAMTRRSVAIA